MLDDNDESPFVVQEVVQGTHLVEEPDRETLYGVSKGSFTGTRAYDPEGG